MGVKWSLKKEQSYIYTRWLTISQSINSWLSFSYSHFMRCGKEKPVAMGISTCFFEILLCVAFACFYSGAEAAVCPVTGRFPICKETEFIAKVKDENGCDTYQCKGCVLPRIGCKLVAVPGTRKSPGECPKFQCSSCPLLPLPPLCTTTEVLKKDKDEQNCDVFKCVGCPIPKILCSAPNFLVAVPGSATNDGDCPTFQCKAPCPVISRFPICKETEVMKIVKDKNGCDEYQCVGCPIPRIGCAAPTKLVPIRGSAKEPGECPAFQCKLCHSLRTAPRPKCSWIQWRVFRDWDNCYTIFCHGQIWFG